MSRPRSLVLLAGLALALVGVYQVWSGRLGDGARFTRVRRTDLSVTADVTGVLRAVESVELGPPPVVRMNEFTVSKLAEEGLPVREGDPVIVFDGTERRKMVAIRESELDSLGKNVEKKEAEYARRRRDADLELARAEADLKRARLKVDVPPELVGSRELARARIELALAEEVVRALERRRAALEAEARADLATERALVDRMRSRVDDGKRIVESLTVRAPRDGTVIYRANDKGEKKRVGDTVWRQERIVELPDLSRMRAEGEVDEADTGRVEVGQAVRLRLDAHPDQEYGGKVESIGNSVERPTTGSPIAVVRIRIALDTTDPIRMRPGMRFRGRIEIAAIDRALVVPGDAIQATGAGPIAFRWTWHGLEPTALVLGQRNGGTFEVLGGLKEGERVALLHSARTGG